jgi:hypothetical protein
MRELPPPPFAPHRAPSARIVPTPRAQTAGRSLVLQGVNSQQRGRWGQGWQREAAATSDEGVTVDPRCSRSRGRDAKPLPTGVEVPHCG